MKQPLLSGYRFTPERRTIDFGAIPAFDLRRLFAVINLTAGQMLYAPGVAGLGLAAVDGPVITLAADTTQMRAGDALLVLYEDGTQPLPTGAATESTLAAIKAALLAQIDLATSVWTDGSRYYVRREVVAEGTGAITVSYTDPAGAAVTPPAGLAPVAADTAIALLTAYYDVKAAGPGHAIGDIVARIVAVNKAVSPPTASAAIWLNMTTGAVIPAPPAANLAEQDQNVVVSAASLPLPTGAATEATLHAAAADLARLATHADAGAERAELEQMRALLAVAAQDGADPAAPAVANAGVGLRGWLATIAGQLGGSLKVVLQAGSALIGRVGIDQGTPGTSNGVYVTNGSVVFADVTAGALTAGGGTAAVGHDAGPSPGPWSRVNAFFFSSQTGTYTIQASNEAGFANAVPVATGALAASTGLPVSLPLTFRYYRAFIVNGQTAATSVNVMMGFSAA